MWYVRKNEKKYITVVPITFVFSGVEICGDYRGAGYSVEGYNSDKILVTIYSGVEWDGATFGIDFERVMPATLLHDVLIRDKGCPFDRKTIDRFFLYAMKQSGFKLWFLYYFFVKTFRIFFRRG